MNTRPKYIEGPTSCEGVAVRLGAGGCHAYKGDFTADNAEIQGAYIAAGTDPQTNLGTSKMTLTDVTVVQAPDATKMNLDVHRELKIVTKPGQAHRAARSANVEIGLLVKGEFHTFTGDPSLPVADPQVQRQLNATYQSLKASEEEISSGRYQAGEGKVRIRRADSTGAWTYEEVPSGNDVGPAERAAQVLEEAWGSYNSSVRNSNLPVDVIPILDIDLSKFTSGTSRAWCVYYIET